MFQQLLDKFGLSFDDLNTAERETLFSWAKSISTKPLTVDDIKSHIASMIVAVERELAGLEEPKHFWSWLFQRRRDKYTKARLKNYLMLKDFLESPERAQQFVEAHLQRIKPNN